MFLPREVLLLSPALTALCCVRKNCVAYMKEVKLITTLYNLVFGGEPIVLGKIWDPQLYILYTSK